MNTPFPVPSIRFDKWASVDVPADYVVGNSYIAFINTNDTETITNLSTAQAPITRATLYFASPANPASRIPIWEYETSQIDQFYISPTGNAIAYFLNDPQGGGTGLYILDVAIGLSGRIAAMPTMTQRGIVSQPVWSPDGRFLAVTLETGYSLGIFIFDVQQSTWSALVNDGSYNFYPAWSPDGRHVAFLSDRATCPTWIPPAPNACNPDTTPSPTGGQVYVLEFATNSITQISTAPVSEPPYWVNSDTLAFASGDSFDLLNPTRSLWIANMRDKQGQEIRLADGGTQQLNLDESWSPDGNLVIFQSAGTTNETIVMNRRGERVTTLDDLSFVRFGLNASWSPDGTRLAVGGKGGQCTYGVRVLETTNFTLVASGSNPRAVCDPVYSSNGSRIAFLGIRTTSTSADGRADVYSGTRDGFEVQSLTSDLRGQTRFVGWVGR
jgi:Tol biopolymer transport system component